MITPNQMITYTFYSNEIIKYLNQSLICVPKFIIAEISLRS